MKHLIFTTFNPARPVLQRVAYNGFILTKLESVQLEEALLPTSGPEHHYFSSGQDTHTAAEELWAGRSPTVPISSPIHWRLMVTPAPGVLNKQQSMGRPVFLALTDHSSDVHF